MHILRGLMRLRLSGFLLNKLSAALRLNPLAASEKIILYLREKSYFIRLKANVMFIDILWPRSAQLNLVIFQLKFSKFPLAE